MSDETCMRKSCSYAAYRQGLCRTHYVPSGYVDATAARNRYQQLRDRGYTVDTIARLTGVNRDTLRQMGTWSQGRVLRETHDRVMAVRVPKTTQASMANVPAIGTRRRIQALAAAGHSLGFIATSMGVTRQAITILLRKDTVTGETATKVAALFDQWQFVIGPSDRARAWAHRRGWAVPLAWDEDTIDDPDASPTLGGPDRRADILADAAARREKVAELTRAGLDAGQIADRMGVTRRHVVRCRAELREAS